MENGQWTTDTTHTNLKNNNNLKMTNPKFPAANPPGHTIAIAIIILVFCLSTIPNIISSIDDVATIQRCATSLFPELMSRAALGWIRVSFGVFIIIVSIAIMSEKKVLKVNYLKSSKLRSLPIHIYGLRAQAFFTSWSWNVLGIYFLSSGFLTLYIDMKLSNSNDLTNMIETLSNDAKIKMLLRVSYILFEIAAPVSMLVSVVVRYVLWPKALKGNGTDELKKLSILIQHNANIIMSLIEVGIMGGVEVRFTHLAVGPLFGITYVLFAWIMKNQWLESGEPQFLYFFLDTTLGKGTSMALLALLVALTLFYAAFVLVDDIIILLGGGLATHIAVVIGIASLTCRFRD